MRRSGYTLVELLLVLSLLAGSAAVVLPPAARWLDAASVRAARDDLAAALALTRALAFAHGGATLALQVPGGRMTVRTESGERRDLGDLEGRYGVRVHGAAGAVYVFPYDAIGIGRFGNRTVALGRGGARAGVAVSTYGRVRRW